MTSAAPIPTPSVAIVIDNYNYARYLVAAMESALAQSYDAVSVIVVDDGSSDESRESLRLGDRVELVLKENGGQASAFNAGSRRAGRTSSSSSTPTTCCTPTPPGLSRIGSHASRSS